MQPKSYSELSDLDLFVLCIWREARGEGLLGKRGVAHVIINRVDRPGWWGHDVRSVILKPYQFSSFNASDPNADKWPADDDSALPDCVQAAQGAFSATPDEDVTSGATFYFSPPLIAPPVKAWGPVEITVKIGNLTFCKSAPVDMRDVTAEP